MSGEVSFFPAPEDWEAANQLWYRRARARRVLIWLGLAALCLAAGLMGFDLIVSRQSVLAALNDAAPMLLFGILVVGAPFLSSVSIPRQVRRQFAQRPSMTDETRYSWDDEGLVGSSRAGTTVQPWRELHRQLRDDRSFVFLPTDRMLLVVPRRALSDAQAADLAMTADRYGPPVG